MRKFSRKFFLAVAVSLLLCFSAFGETMQTNIKPLTAFYVSPAILIEVLEATMEGDLGPAFQAGVIGAFTGIPYNETVEITDSVGLVVEVKIKGKAGYWYTMRGWLR